MKKKIILLTGFVFLLVSLGVLLFFVKQQQEIRQKAAAATVLSLVPNSITKNAGETFSLDVNIATAENSVIASEIHISFDGTKLQALSITNSPQFPNILSSGVVETGKASITVGAPSISQPFSGNGTIATIQFKALQATTTPISVTFDEGDTYVGSPGEGKNNALIGANPATVTINGEGSTITPTPTTSSSTITPTATPTTASTGPTNTPTPTTTGVPTTLTISNPSNGATISQNPPTLSGRAPPGNTVTVVLSPGNITQAVTVDSSGNWTYTPASALGVGVYSATITSTNMVTGASQTSTLSFTITSTTVTSTPTRTPTPTTGSASTTTPSPTTATVPVTGNSTPTFLILGAAFLLIFCGILIPIL